MAARRQPASGEQGRTARKPLVVTVAVLCALLAVLIGVLLLRNPLLCAAAKREIGKGDFRSAAYTISHAGGSRAQALEAYIDLRLDINNGYPALLSDFDREKVEGWFAKADALSVSDALDADTKAQAEEVRNRTGLLLDLLDDYERLRPTVLSAMDVFGEINRLYTKSENGRNPAFTVVDELAKVDAWEAQNAQIIVFADSVENAESCYLLNYLIKEIQGECADLRAAMDTVLANGYKETDRIRLTGEQHKVFPSIQNGSVSVNVAEKDVYETYLYQSVCRTLTQSLGTLYSAS
ncbi:MAG: hypothetical protein IJK64_00950 [Clostridia bacterium]|nr:hypothetical protein [Clostridia bacterium]